MAPPLVFTTPCGHEASVKLCQSKSGPNAGKWVVKIKGRKVKLKSGVKTKYCSPNEKAAKQAIAEFLGIQVSTIITGKSGAVVVKKEEAKATKASAMTATSTATTTSVASYPPPAQQQPPAAMVAAYPPYSFFPSHMPNQPCFPPAGLPPVFGFPVGLTSPGVPSASMGNVTYPPAPGMFSGGPSVIPSTLSTAVATNVPLLNQADVVADANKENTATKDTNVSAIKPTAEQERIYQHAKPPTPMDTNFTVRITAGAGAGKTTTVLQVASKAARLGHSHITYVTFAKAAAADGARRIQEALSGFPNPPTIEARTLHSCAMKLLSEDRKEAFVEENSRLIDDEALQSFIKTACDREVQDFLAHAREEIHSRNKEDPRKAASMTEAAERQVLFFIFKTFTQFCRSPYMVEQFNDPNFKYRNYFPAEKFHQDGKEGEKQGFPSMVYRFKLGKYADIACLVWDAATQQGIRSYDMEMKRAQLKALRIPGSLLLVDESQDMDGCQVDWIAKQCYHGTHVYIVGDAAQTIYSFRGAKSKYMVNLKGAVDFELTKSWRFGSNIASIANVILFGKHKSKQTKSDNPTWQ